MKAAVFTASTAVASDRVAGFDLLRGICALAVAAYHVSSWVDPTIQLHTWGTYAVYIFFVLSGASMYIAYKDRFAAGYSPARFLAMRLVRLAPLYLLAMLAGFLLAARHGTLGAHDLWQGYLNVFFLFGLGAPTAAQVTGGWSLGVEFVFYLLFPVLLAVAAGRYWLWLLLLAFTSQHVYIHTVLANGKALEANWIAYTQFLSFGFYFAAGCVIGRGVHTGKLRAHWLALPVFVLALAVVGGVGGESAAATLTGFAGLGLSLLAAAAVAAAAVLPLGGVGGWLSEHLGKASYGVYILHPFLFGPGKRLSGGSPIAAVLVTVALSVLLALVLERWFERPVQAYFKRPARA